MKIENGNTSVVATFATLAEARKSARALQRQAMDDEERAIGREGLGHYAMMDAIEHAKQNPVQFLAAAAQPVQSMKENNQQEERE